MRQRAARKRNVLQPRETNVGHELATAAHQPIVFLPWQAHADALSGARACGRKLALIAHGGVLPGRADADLLTPQRPAAELALLRRNVSRHAGKTSVAADARR